MAVANCAAYRWSAGISSSRCSASAALSARCCLQTSFWSRTIPSLSNLRYLYTSSTGAHESGTSRPFSIRGLISAGPIRTRSEAVKYEVEERTKPTDSEIETETNNSLGQDVVPSRAGFPPLENKAKKELRAYAHGLGTRLNVQQVGKLGVSQTVVHSISDALEANEIVKVKVLENCPADMTVIMGQLERGTGGQVVGKIGRTVLLYRASLRKLAATEKRSEPQRHGRKVASLRGPGKGKQKSRR